MPPELEWRTRPSAAGHSPLPVLPGWAIWFLYACAIYSFVRTHLANAYKYISLRAYLNGTVALPYQRRLLPLLLVRALNAFPLSRWIIHRLDGRIVPPGLFPFFLIDLLSFAAASFFCVRLYRKAAVRPWSAPFVLAILLFTTSWTYMLSPEDMVYYPYDLASLAFFTAGLYCIYTRRFGWLLLSLLVGSFNRETTLFLIPLFLLDTVAKPSGGLRELQWRRIPIVKTLLLVAAWVLVKAVLGRFYVHNDATDEYLRLRENLHFLLPNKWPQILCACGFLLPVVLYLRPRVPDARLRAYLLVIPLWIAVMFVYAVLSEVRVFGELCSLVTVAAALLLDTFIESRAARLPG